MKVCYHTLVVTKRSSSCHGTECDGGYIRLPGGCTGTGGLLVSSSRIWCQLQRSISACSQTWICWSERQSKNKHYYLYRLTRMVWETLTCCAKRTESQAFWGNCSTLEFKFKPGGTRSLIQFGFLLFGLLTCRKMYKINQTDKSMSDWINTSQNNCTLTMQ